MCIFILQGGQLTAFFCTIEIMETAVLAKTRTRKPKSAAQVPDSSASQKIILQNVSWQTYEQMLSDQTDVAGLHLYYNKGSLEIMTESFKHGETASLLGLIVAVIAETLEVEFTPAGNTTFKREKNKAGFEGDGSFYFQHADAVRGKNKIDLKIDPPPELVIEVDVTHPSLPKFPIFARLGVAEIWRYNGAEVKFHRLQNKSYVEADESIFFAGVTGKMITSLLDSKSEMKTLKWLKLVRETVKKD